MRRLLKIGGMTAATVIAAGVLFLAIAGVPKPPAITSMGVPRIPWTPIAEAASLVTKSLKGATLVDWQPSGEGLVVRSQRLTGSTLSRVSSPGAIPEKFLSLSRDTAYVVLNPDPRKNLLLYSEDDRGDEFGQLFLYDLAARTARRLTSGHSRNVSPIFDRKGERLAFLSEDNSGDMKTRVNIPDLSQPSSVKTLCRIDGSWWLSQWSPDGKHIPARRNFPPNLPFLYSLDVRTGEFHRLGSGQEGKVTHTGGLWSHDGRYVYYASDADTEFLTLRRIDMASGREETLTTGITWDAAAPDISADDTTLAVLLNREGAKRLYLLDTRTKEMWEVPGIPDGSILDATFHPAALKLAWSLMGLDGTPSAGTYDLGSASAIEWTARSAAHDAGQPQPRLIHYPTFDNEGGSARMIPAWFWQAPSAGGKPTPVLISIHGGPDGQSGPVESASGLLASRGVSELRPNVRGSTGYGKTYRTLDDRPSHGCRQRHRGAARLDSHAARSG